MKRIDVVKKGNKWVGESGGKTVRGTSGATKPESVRNTADVANKSKEPVTVKFHKEDGKIQEERTYPGSADPHRSKG